MCKGATPTPKEGNVDLLISALASKSKRQQSTLPCAANKCNAVWPFSLKILGSLGRSRNPSKLLMWQDDAFVFARLY